MAFKFLRKISLLLLVFTVFLFLCGFKYDPVLLDDYDGKFKDALVYLEKQGIFTLDHYGKDFTFQSLNRATFVKMVVESNLAKYGENDFQKSTDCFWDVHSEWFADSACFLKKIGIVTGKDGYFYPEQLVTLPEALKIVANTHHYFNHQPLLQNGKDIWFEPYLDFMIKNRALSEGLSQIPRNIWRADTAEMLYRLQNHITDKQTGIIFIADQDKIKSPFSWWYKVDKNDELYFLDWKLGVKIKDFHYIGHGLGDDGKFVYSEETKLYFLDPKSLELVGYNFIKDKNGFYVGNAFNPEVFDPFEVKDPSTFVPCDSDYAEDQYFSYDGLGIQRKKGIAPCPAALNEQHHLVSKALKLDFTFPYADCREDESIADGGKSIGDFIPKGRKVAITCNHNLLRIDAVSKDWRNYEGLMLGLPKQPSLEEQNKFCKSSSEMICLLYQLAGHDGQKRNVFVMNMFWAGMYDDGFWLGAYLPLKNNPYYETARISMRLGDLPADSKDQQQETKTYLQNVIDKKLPPKDLLKTRALEKILQTLKNI